MDAELARLRRAAEAEPANEAAARAYDTALKRSGQAETVHERFRLNYRCELDWNALPTGPEPGKRHCGQCDRDVHYVTSSGLMLEHMAAGRCVAFPANCSNENFAKLVESEVLSSARASGSPCAVEETPQPEEMPFMGVVAVPMPRHLEVSPPVPRDVPKDAPAPRPNGVFAAVRRLFGLGE